MRWLKYFSTYFNFDPSGNNNWSERQGMWTYWCNHDCWNVGVYHRCSCCYCVGCACLTLIRLRRHIFSTYFHFDTSGNDNWSERQGMWTYWCNHDSGNIWVYHRRSCCNCVGCATGRGRDYQSYKIQKNCSFFNICFLQSNLLLYFKQKTWNYFDQLSHQHNWKNVIFCMTYLLNNLFITLHLAKIRNVVSLI